MNTSPLSQLVQKLVWVVYMYLATCNVLNYSTRYRGGLRGRQKAVIIELLQDYYQVESVFQGQLISYV